ncbi:alpha/beta fold hydrolase [Saccharothrix violaceirubra]|uniref:Pimeloyl-ACP methyl ester carboxylesterase n=1 Tax=Saccharothrix violaceirubra TaxID=413306 RepID=A0A7W7WVB2_9PSEU|nr:alpha/beta hydrolase [Saccharothrix violaceirubra]MBB4964742.1 pimeloyl-ACP methyl ester carboxylesterase [Saccharothrix violaceirubra]
MTTALLLAHGAGGAARPNFGPLIPALSRTRRVFAPDLPGSGTTPRAAGPLELDDLADFLIAAADTDTVDILGYSLGCGVAVRAAVRHPDRVSRLVLTSGFVRADDHVRERSGRWRELLAGDRDELARFVMELVLGDPFRHAMTPEQVEGFLEIIQLTLPPGVDEQVALVQRLDVGDDVAKVAAPTLVIGTRHDNLVRPAASRALADAIPDAEYAELDSGHAPALETPKEWLRLVEGFLT